MDEIKGRISQGQAQGQTCDCAWRGAARSGIRSSSASCARPLPRPSTSSCRWLAPPPGAASRSLSCRRPSGGPASFRSASPSAGCSRSSARAAVAASAACTTWPRRPSRSGARATNVRGRPAAAGAPPAPWGSGPPVSACQPGRPTCSWNERALDYSELGTQGLHSASATSG
jgi:hypothetical protein